MWLSQCGNNMTIAYYLLSYDVLREALIRALVNRQANIAPDLTSQQCRLDVPVASSYA